MTKLPFIAEVEKRKRGKQEGKGEGEELYFFPFPLFISLFSALPTSCKKRLLQETS